MGCGNCDPALVVASKPVAEGARPADSIVDRLLRRSAICLACPNYAAGKCTVINLPLSYLQRTPNPICTRHA